MKRRLMIPLITALVAFMPLAGVSAADNVLPKVYMTKDISPAGLQKVYAALERVPAGKVAIKLSVGEPGNNYYLDPALLKDLVQSVNGTFIDSNTAYNGGRSTTENHLKAAVDHGFTAVAPMDVLDAEGEIALPITGGTHLKEVLVGSHFSNYNSIVVLSHFKGHAMGGFGGALKNISIGIASITGKNLVHTAGKNASSAFSGLERPEYFPQAMAEAAKGMIAAMGPENMLYISVMNNLSVDCDCDSSPSVPEMHDLGILSSLDPVALDKACVDLVYAADEKESAALRERMESRYGAQILVHAEKIGVGSQAYELVMLDD